MGGKTEQKGDLAKMAKNCLELVWTSTGHESFSRSTVCSSAKHRTTTCQPPSPRVSNWTSPVRLRLPGVLVVSCCAVPPLYVGILRTGNPLVAGLPRTLECQVLVVVYILRCTALTGQATGARPRPRISWWKDGQPLRESEIQVHLFTVLLYSTVICQ